MQLRKILITRCFKQLFFFNSFIPFHTVKQEKALSSAVSQPHRASLWVYFYPPHFWALFDSLKTFSKSWKKILQTKLASGSEYSWNGRLFHSQMFITRLYIKNSQDLCANSFSLVVAALKLQSLKCVVSWWEILVCGCAETPGGRGINMWVLL